MASLVSAQQVVFEDSFDDNITSNATGTGQLVPLNLSPGNVTASEAGGRLLFSNAVSGSGREGLIDGPVLLLFGFRLSFDYQATGNFNSQTLNIGLFDDPTDLDVGLTGPDVFGSGSTGNGLGFGALARGGRVIPGLIEQTGGAGGSAISTLQTNGLPALNDQSVSGSVSITFNPDTTYSFTANGQTTTGTLPATSGFNLANPLHLLVITQGAEDVSIDNLLLESLTVPEPTSLAFFALAGLGIFTRRRRY